MRVQRIGLANLLLQLSDLREQPPRERRKREETFFDLDTFGRERQEEIGPRVRVDDRLEACLGLAHLEDRPGFSSFFPTAPRKLPITAMSGLKIFDIAVVPPYTGNASLRPACPGGSGWHLQLA